jgi:butyrate kinase
MQERQSDTKTPGTFRILAINPGSTSTKISVYENTCEVFTHELKHTPEELRPFDGKSVTSQFEFRKDAITLALADNNMSMDDIDAVSARGGLLWPMEHGTYHINDLMAEDLKAGVQGEHASNLGGLIARKLVNGTGKQAFIVDPEVVDEMPSRAKITGIKEIKRRAISHVLSQMASNHRYAEENGTEYEKLNLIVAHMGGGISVGAHKQGRYLDVNNALDGDGPFSPQRCGTLPTGQWMRLVQSGKYSAAELKQLNKGRGGLINLLGTADLMVVENKVLAGDPEFCEVFEAMCYQISKAITALLPAFDGDKVDQIILTGGMARCQILVEKIKKYVSAMGCGVTVYPGENEMMALVKGALRVLTGHEVTKEYVGKSLPTT